MARTIDKNLNGFDLSRRIVVPAVLGGNKTCPFGKGGMCGILPSDRQT